jgi:hypothetical protein
MKTKLGKVLVIDERSIQALNLEKEVRLSSMRAVALLAYERGYRDCEIKLPFDIGRKNVENIFKRA